MANRNWNLCTEKQALVDEMSVYAWHAIFNAFRRQLGPLPQHRIVISISTLVHPCIVYFEPELFKPLSQADTASIEDNTGQQSHQDGSHLIIRILDFIPPWICIQLSMFHHRFKCLHFYGSAYNCLFWFYWNPSKVE